MTNGISGKQWLAVQLIVVLGVLALPSSLLWAWYQTDVKATQARAELCQGLNQNRDVLRSVLTGARDFSLSNNPDPADEKRIRLFYASALSRVKDIDCTKLTGH